MGCLRGGWSLERTMLLESLICCSFKMDDSRCSADAYFQSALDSHRGHLL
jgi:hypothetical protein